MKDAPKSQTVVCPACPSLGVLPENLSWGYCDVHRTKRDSPDELDPVNPSHYKSHPSGVECIQVTEHMGFCLGNAVKYIWRADLKNNDIEDLEKAKWYLDREIQKRKKI